MSNRLPCHNRLHALTAAALLVLSSTVATPALAQHPQTSLSGLQPHAGNDRFIVKYRPGSAARNDAAAARGLLDRAGAHGVGGKGLRLVHVRRIATGADVVRTDRDLDRVEAATLMRQIASDPNVEYVEVDKLNQALLTPDDTRYDQQWGYSGRYGIKANQAWDTTRGEGVVVAVLDSGITRHSDLDGNVLAGYDFITDTAISNDGDGRDNDAGDPGDWAAANQCRAGSRARNSSWHGTHVAGTIAAVTNNGQGVAGVAHGARILPVRVLGTCGGYDSDIADAITWSSGGVVRGVPANSDPAEVINLSLGAVGSCGRTVQAAINGAVARGTTLVIAAGNDNIDVARVSPASCDNVIAVASTTSTGARSSFSNHGSLIDIAAPGSNILSTLNVGATSPQAETYGVSNGTSMAAPHVAGVVALIQSLAAVPNSPAEVEALIKDNVGEFPSPPSQPIGPGILDAAAVVNAVRRNAGWSMHTYRNDSDHVIDNFAIVESPITVAGPSGNAPVNAEVTVDIVHPYKGELVVDLVAPDGSIHNIHDRSGAKVGSLSKTVTLDLSGEARIGTWKLRVNDSGYFGDGYINGWSISL
ncbi:MAG TPA: S8 family serine peptidase [Lysobacter sp.]